MYRAAIYAGLGYLSGSILFAKVAEGFFKKDVTRDSSDRNPGAFNAFRYGGFWCGLMTLLGDLLKGFLPVYCYANGNLEMGRELACVLAAPVAGHIFPVFYGFHGGKGIAVSFGCLLGLMPEYRPAGILAFFFLLFSLIVKISPNYYRTIAAYVFSLIGMLWIVPVSGMFFGFAIISALIMLKLLTSTEERERFRVDVLWKH